MPIERMPAIFLSHGAPPLLDDLLWCGELADWAAQLPVPEAILCVSAHWERAPATLSAAAAGTPLVYDFGGFPQRFFELTYPTPDATKLAEQVETLLSPHLAVQSDARRGLDHGTWVPLMVMYPAGDIPILQLSLPTHDPVALAEIGAALRPLRDDGVLLVGSGFATHGLAHLTRAHWMQQAGPPDWSVAFDRWFADALSRGDRDALADYPSAPGMPFAHPTPEHFSPVFVTLGAATDPTAPVRTRVDGFFMGLSKRSFEVD